MSDLSKVALGASAAAPKSVPAATVVILRVGAEGVEVLLLRKN
jgi:hypothetical protein